jgi:UDP-N-acetylmuramoyl-L-alanyl-D-glutamate--2,6-diaminopimelate ligase
MLISELIAGLPLRLERGDPGVEISDIVEDSRQVRPGSLFIARRGAVADGRRFIPEAARAGAAAVLTSGPSPVPEPLVAIVAPDPALASALLAERLCGSPSARLSLVGVTGTNGKTTTAHLVQQLLNHAGSRCGLIGTVQIDDGATVRPSTLTTPPAIEISRWLRAMIDHGCRACAMEVSSHALDQQRVAGLSYKVGIFTNLTGDHLDYHRTMDAYAAAKSKLFCALSDDAFAVVNADDAAHRTMIDGCRARVMTCSVRDRAADCHAEVTAQDLRGMGVTMSGAWGRFECSLPLLGLHNVSNALQAAAACSCLGVDGESIRVGLEACAAPPGRLEPVTTAADAFAVLVDYAHTDDALRNVLTASRPFLRAGARLRVVFGCGGDRDRSKRPRMAAVAASCADDVIITSDNPRTENPQAIIHEIAAGIPHARRADCELEPDRRRAIVLAIERAQPGDIVIIAGKGHEDYQIVGTTKRPFDDRTVAREALTDLRERMPAS